MSPEPDGYDPELTDQLLEQTDRLLEDSRRLLDSLDDRLYETRERRAS